MGVFRNQLSNLLGKNTTREIKALRAIFLICFVLGVFLRLYHLSEIPGMHTDEAGYGLWGRDIHLGIYYPLIEESAGKSGPLFIYLISVAYKVFGMDLYAIRFVVAFFGILSIITTYLLARSLFNEKVALFSASLMSVSSCFVTHSRIGFDTNLLPFFLTLSLYFLVASRKKRETLYLSLSGLLLGLSLHLHPTAIIGIPLALFLIWMLYKQDILKKSGFYLGFVMMLLALSPFIIFNLENNLYSLQRATEETSIHTFSFSAFMKDMAVGFKELGDTLTGKTINYWEWGGYQFGHHLKFIFPIDFAFLIVGLILMAISHKKNDLFLIFWLILSLIVLVIYTTGGYSFDIDLRLFPYRLNIIFPALVIFEGVALARISDFIAAFRHLRILLLIVFISALAYHLSIIKFDYFGWYEQTGGAGRYTMGKEQVSEYIMDNTPYSGVLISDSVINFGPRSLKFLTNGNYLILTPTPPEVVWNSDDYAKFIEDVNLKYANRDRVFVFVVALEGEREISPFLYNSFRSIYPQLEPSKTILGSNGQPAFYIYVLKEDLNAVVYYCSQEAHVINRAHHVVITTQNIVCYTWDEYDDREGYTWWNGWQTWYKKYNRNKVGEIIENFNVEINLDDIQLVDSSQNLKEIKIPITESEDIVITASPNMLSVTKHKDGAIVSEVVIQ